MKTKPDIILINSKEINYAITMGDMPPLGLLLLATLLENNGYSVKVIDLNIPETDYLFLEEYLRQIKEVKLVGISCLTQSYLNGVRIARMIKDHDIRTTIVMGGPHTTFQDKEAIETGVVDIVVRNEGEESFLEVCNCVINHQGSLAMIKGITYKDNDQIVVNEKRTGVQDLDTLPVPKREYVHMHLYSRPFHLITSRGCPGNCIFCAANSLSGRNVRRRDPDNIIKEVEYLHRKYNANMITIADDTFTYGNKERLIEIANYFKKHDIMWSCESRVDVRDKSIFEYMVNHNCISIQIGIESLDQGVLDFNEKKISIDQIEEVLNICRNLNIVVISNIIAGMPGDTREKFIASMNLMCDLAKKYYILSNCSICTPFPGTRIFDEPEKYGVQIKSYNWDLYDMGHPIFETKYLSLRDQKELHYMFMRKYNKDLPFKVLDVKYKSHFITRKLFYNEQRDHIFKS